MLLSKRAHPLPTSYTAALRGNHCKVTEKEKSKLVCAMALPNETERKNQPSTKKCEWRKADCSSISCGLDFCEPNNSKTWKHKKQVSIQKFWTNYFVTIVKVTNAFVRQVMRPFLGVQVSPLNSSPTFGPTVDVVAVLRAQILLFGILVLKTHSVFFRTLLRKRGNWRLSNICVSQINRTCKNDNFSKTTLRTYTFNGTMYIST